MGGLDHDYDAKIWRAVLSRVAHVFVLLGAHQADPQYRQGIFIFFNKQQFFVRSFLK